MYLIDETSLMPVFKLQHVRSTVR